MSAPAVSAPGTGKKAVHVKWAGKTIALGTFPSAEADEKCQKAKALTRAWRSTMRPKPSREWVMLELERLGVRVVSGRLGRKAGEEGEDVAPAPQDKQKAMPAGNDAGAVPGGNMVAGGGAPGMQGRSPSIGWGGSDADLTNLMARRNSLGLSMMNDTLGRRGSLGSLGQVMGLDTDPTIPPHRPFVGGGAAAAYEAARHDHFAQKSAEQQRRASGLGLGSLTGGGALGGMGAMSVNPNQHYEMLKLHHMNLLNEIQETTLMMNLYQQQQLQQQQQQLQQQASAEQMPGGGGGGGGGSSSDPQISMLMQQNSGVGGSQSMDNLFGANGGNLQQRSSLGLGSGNFGANGLSGNNLNGDAPGSLPGSSGLQQEGQNASDQKDGKSQSGNSNAEAASNKRINDGGDSMSNGQPQTKKIKTEPSVKTEKDSTSSS